MGAGLIWKNCLGELLDFGRRRVYISCQNVYFGKQWEANSNE